MTHPMPLGAIPRKPKPTDWMMSALALPQITITNKTWQSPIRIDQGGYGSCVTNGMTHLLTCSPIQHPDHALLDPAKQPSYATMGSSAYWPHGYQADPIGAELYALRMYDIIHDGVMEPLDPERDDGCQVEDGLKILKRRGMITGYYRAGSVDEVIQAVLTMGPVAFASPWYRSMDNTPKLWGDNRYVDVDVSTGIRGYHLYVIDAANLAPAEGPPFGTILNSWGPMWGTRGRARVTVDDLATLWIANAWVATGERIA